MSVAIYNGMVYAGTEEGLYSVARKGTNLTDFSIWQQIPADKGLPQSYDVRSLAVKFNSLYALIENKVYKSTSDGKFKVVYTPSDASEVIKYISDDGTQIMVGVEKNFNTKTIFINQDEITSERPPDCVNRGVYAVEDEKDGCGMPTRGILSGIQKAKPQEHVKDYSIRYHLAMRRAMSGLKKQSLFWFRRCDG